MIELTGIRAGWPDAAPVLAGIDLRVREGERLVLMGANGSGKSTLLKLLAGLVFPSVGEHRRGGWPVTDAGLRDKARARSFRAATGLLFQHPDAMLFNPTVLDEIAWGPRRLGWADADARALAWAQRLGLGHRLDAAPHALSGGEKQKVALAAVLAGEPALLLLDEPAAHLDAHTTGWLLDHLQDASCTVVASTHSREFAAGLGGRCVVLDRGRIAFDGDVDAALADAALLERTGLAWRRRVVRGAHSA